MKWIRDANRVVSTFAKLERQKDKVAPEKSDGKGYTTNSLLISDLLEEVTSRYKSINVSRANRLVAYILREKYLLPNQHKMEKDKELYVAISEKGELFIDTAFGIPVGFLKAWYKDDGKIVLAILGSLLTLVISAIGGIVVVAIKIAEALS